MAAAQISSRASFVDSSLCKPTFDYVSFMPECPDLRLTTLNGLNIDQILRQTQFRSSLRVQQQVQLKIVDQSMEQSQGPCLFLGLPLEVRHLIYQYVFSDSYLRATTDLQSTLATPSNPCSFSATEAKAATRFRVRTSESYNAILSCRQVYREARSIFLQNSSLSLSKTVTSADLPCILSEAARHRVRRVFGLSTTYAWRGFTFERGSTLNEVFPALETFVMQADQVLRLDSIDEWTRLAPDAQEPSAHEHVVQTKAIDRATLEAGEKTSLEEQDRRKRFEACLSAIVTDTDTYRFFLEQANFTTLITVEAIVNKSENGPTYNSTNNKRTRYLLILNLKAKTITIGEPLLTTARQKRFRWNDLLDDRRDQIPRSDWVEDGSLTNI